MKKQIDSIRVTQYKKNDSGYWDYKIELYIDGEYEEAGFYRDTLRLVCNSTACFWKCDSPKKGVTRYWVVGGVIERDILFDNEFIACKSNKN